MNDSEAQLKQTELDLARHESNCGHIREQLQQDYQLDEAAARSQNFAELQEMDLAALQRQESRLTLQIADLGPINAAAIEEYNAVKERSEFLCKQYNDLCTAKENLEAVIAEINSGMTKRFKEAFAKIKNTLRNAMSRYLAVVRRCCGSPSRIICWIPVLISMYSRPAKSCRACI